MVNHGLVGFSLVLQGFWAVLGSWNPPFVLFDPRKGHFYTPKHIRFKRKMSSFDATNTINMGKTPKGQMVPFSHMYHPNGNRCYSIFLSL